MALDHVESGIVFTPERIAELLRFIAAWRAVHGVVRQVGRDVAYVY